MIGELRLDLLGAQATLVIRLALGFVLVSAAVDKALHGPQFSRQISALGIPSRWAPSVGALVCVVETSLGAALIVGILWRAALLLSALLLLGFLLLILATARWRPSAANSNCGCGGIAGVLTTADRAPTRNLILASIAVVGALPQASALSMPVSMPALTHVSTGIDAASLAVAFATLASGAAALAGREIWFVRSRRRLIDTTQFGDARG